MSVENLLVVFQLVYRSIALSGAWPCRIRRRRQASELQQTGHQQQPRFGSREIATRDGQRVALGVDKAAGVTPPDFNHRHAAKRSSFERRINGIAHRAERR